MFYIAKEGLSLERLKHFGADETKDGPVVEEQEKREKEKAVAFNS